MDFKEIKVNDIISNKQQQSIGPNNLVEIDPTKILPKKKKEEPTDEITLSIINKAKVDLANAVERKKYEFAMRRMQIKQAIAEKKLQDEVDAEINTTLTDEELIEKEMMEEDASENSFVKQDVVYNFTNKYN